MEAYAFAYVDSRLERWGEWCERLIDGLHEPTAVNAIARLNEGGAGQPGHRILCLEMPRGVWFTNYHVLHLPAGQCEAVTVWYVFNVKPSGGCYSGHDKADLLGIGYDALRNRLHAARERLLSRLLST